jgi:hypothetical protein
MDNIITDFDHFVQNQTNDLKKNQDYILNQMTDVLHTLPKEEANMTQEDIKDIQSIASLDIQGSVLEEHKHASDEEREATLKKQREIVNEIRKRNGMPPQKPPPAPPPSRRNPPQVSQYRRQQDNMPQFVKDLINEASIQGLVDNNTRNHDDTVVAIIGDNIIKTSPKLVKPSDNVSVKTSQTSLPQTFNETPIIPSDEIIETIIL